MYILSRLAGQTPVVGSTPTTLVATDADARAGAPSDAVRAIATSCSRPGIALGRKSIV